MAAKKTSAPKKKAAAAKATPDKPAAVKAAPAKPAATKPAKAAAKKTPPKNAAKKAAVKAVEPVAEPAVATTSPAETVVHRFSPELLALDALVTAKSKSVVTIVPSSFEDAKEQAIDRLIDLIEVAEVRLHQLKRAASYEDFVAAVNENNSEL